MAKTKEPLSLERKQFLARKYFLYFDREIKMRLAGKRTRDMIPDLLFRDGEDCYTDGGDHIVIGLTCFLYTHVYTDEQFVITTKYLINHELGHCEFTADKAWLWGINTGRHAIYTALADVFEGAGRRFVKDSDYDNFREAMSKKGVYFTDDQIVRLCHGIQNSLEDGRTERMSSKEDFSFLDSRDYHRGIFWLEGKADYPNLSDPSEIVRCCANQVLSAATTGLYQNGYSTSVTPAVENRVNGLEVYIARGVYSPSCQDCMEEAVKIEKALIPDIIEMVRNQKCMPKSMGVPEYHPTGVTSRSEIKDSDESAKKVWDELGKEEEKDKKDGSSGSASGKDAEKKGEKKDGKGAGKGGCSRSSEKSGEGKDSGHCSDGPLDPGGFIKDSSGKDKDASDTVDGEFRMGPTNLVGNRVIGVRDERISSNPDAVAEAIEERMRQAADGTLKKAAETAESMLPDMPKDSDEVSDTDALAQASRALTDEYRKEGFEVRFEERKRLYDLTDPLPSDLQGEAETFRQEVEKLQHKEITPMLKGMRSGTVDPTKLWRLPVGHYDFFERKAPDKPRRKAVYVLVDNSGSMGWGSKRSKRAWANRALAVIEEGFKKIAPMKIVAFDAQGADYVTHEVIKGWNERHSENCSYNFLTKGRSGNGNKDGYSIRVAKEELMRRPEEDKLLIVLSDGAPTDYKGVSPEADVREAVAETRAAGIRVVGIFFAGNWKSNPEAEGFRAMYVKDCVTTSPDHIIDHLVRVLKGFFFDRAR